MISIKKYIILTSIVLILSLICISSVSAANFDDDASSENLLKTNEETTITDNGKNDISLNGKQTENYGNKVTGPNVNNAENDMSFTDLEAAIEKAQAKGTNYTLTGNVIYDTDIDNPGAITIQQANMVIDGAGYTIDAKGMTGIFKITGTNVLLKNLKIINAKDDNGGALLIYGNNSKIIDCEFINCNAINEAGAIYSNGSNCNISYCNFTNCSSNNYTGAVFINGENSTIDSCNFENNTAYTSAGALGVGRVDNVKVRNCTFNNNYITIDTMEDGFGGAIYWNNNTGGIIENSTFTNNNAKFCAAAICWCGYDGVINNCNFIGNNVYENGGAIYLYLGTGNNITNSRFEDNRAKRGAGILTNGENTTIENCTFLNNNAFHEAGALYLNASNCNVKYCNFTNCSSDNYTGAVFVKSDNAIIDSCKFDNNSAGISAGALGVGLVDYVTVNNCTFTNNHVTEQCGGAIYWNTNTGGIIANSTFLNNSADHNGSAIYYDGNNGTIKDCTFIGNTVGENGGAIYIAGKNNIIYASNFMNNSAAYGSAIYTSSNLDVLNSSFENNNISKTDNVWVNIIQNPDKIQLIGKNVVYTINYDGTYTVTLKDLEGTPIVGKTIQFVLNGKNIGSATTNANGVATIKISANALKAAKAGTKNLKINFNQKIYAPITKTVKVTINKEKSKLTASSKKYNLRLKTKKYTVVLKNSKNKAIKNAKLTLKIKGKTYKASTNSQGKANFKINKLYKKGTFASVVKFAGNDYYKGVSKKVKIVIR